MKFALVEWVNNNSTSIILSTGIRNKTMLSDTTLVDKVEFVRESKVPSTGWPAYDAKVLAVSGMYSQFLVHKGSCGCCVTTHVDTLCQMYGTVIKAVLH